MLFRKKTKNKKAFSLVEILIVIFIASVVFTSFYSVSTMGTRYIIEAKNRLAAVALANEKMEIVRNLAYDKVGIQGSIDISGNLLPEEDVTANGRSYHVSMSVRYFDDPMDGTTTSSPADLIPNDYKIVRVIISWSDTAGQMQKVSLSSRFVPPGLETSAGGSPLAINVVDSDTLLPVPQAVVHITNNTMSPVINDSIQTDNEGHIMLPAAKISSDDHLSITKSGYENLETMDSSATFLPVYGHVSVVGGFLNTYNYFINRLSTLTVKTADYQNNSVGNIEFSIKGGKIIGHDNLGVSVFSLPPAIATTDATTGEKKYQDIVSGSYEITMNANTQYAFIDYDPAVFPAVLPPSSDTTYTLRVADKNVNSLFLKVKDADAVGAPIVGAKVTLTDGATDIFTEKLTSLNGILFYPDNATPLENKEYTLKIEADGYTSDSRTITINNLTSVEVSLTKI
ncbi:MAG: prepilin-type N-terminal cleavage/methylation domain-containing protein [Candidatus Moranbacteria bacterium]|nr:prepilin-type N-terminal cleavage/methylation domain-containing protein [Candidatus Moranbacteria bacterium]